MQVSCALLIASWMFMLSSGLAIDSENPFSLSVEFLPSLERQSYTVAEDAGSVEVCVAANIYTPGENDYSYYDECNVALVTSDGGKG